MAADKPDPNDPSNISPAYACMAPRWALINTLLGGTPAMRAAGESYLPKHTDESETDYKERLNMAVLYNMTEFILDTLASKPFAEPIKLADDVPPPIVELTEDINSQGDNLDVFAFRWFRDGLAKAFSAVLVEFPRVTPNPDGSPRTLEQDRQDKLRPYWVPIAPENIIYAMSQYIDGVETLVHVRIREVETRRVGFIEMYVPRIRVLEPGLVTLYELAEQKKDGKEVWVQVDQYTTSIDFIPLVIFYTDRTASFEGKPPLTDLAHINVSHWQSTSDQRKILTVARFPILACAGADDEGKKLVIGPNSWLSTKDAQGRFYYVEHTGQAIEAGRKDLKDLEEQMASYGAEFLKEQPGGMTATARALDSAEAVSPLQVMTLSFKDAIELALLYTAKWLKLESGGSVTLNLDFNMEADAQGALTALDQSRSRKDISRKAHLEELRRRGVLSEEYDPDADKEEIDEEAATLNGAATFDLDPNAPADEDPNNPNPSPSPEPSPAPGGE